MVQWFKQEKSLSGGVNFKDEENMPEDENGQVDLSSAGGPKAVGRRPPLSISVGICRQKKFVFFPSLKLLYKLWLKVKFRWPPKASHHHRSIELFLELHEMVYRSNPPG
jgi:hypothetical protein